MDETIKRPKIGLVTFHYFNYGSALQCYASQEFLKRKGYDVEVIDVLCNYSKLQRYFMTLWNLLTLCVLHPFSTKTIISVFTSQRRRSLRITEESEGLIEKFNDGFVNRALYTIDVLKQKSRRGEFYVFLTGSDQVWNVSRIDLYDLYFLRFAPSYKRVSWAASFGGVVIAPYNIKRYAKYLRGFRAISVRENSAINIVKKLAKRDAVSLADPVILFDAEDWRSQYQKAEPELIIKDKKYILLFFLDNPSEQAKRVAEQLLNIMGCDMVTIGYKQIGVSDHQDGSPWSFLSMIDNASYVLTDSFHATVFSLLFHRPFFVFDRRYVHKQSQSSRITDLLTEVRLIDRYNPTEVDELMPDFNNTESFFSRAREEYDKFISNNL